MKTRYMGSAARAARVGNPHATMTAPTAATASQLNAPAFFGSPFGFKTEETFHCVVAIRGLGWHGENVTLPSGCGIVGGSAFDHEWRELKLKRESVARLLGV